MQNLKSRNEFITAGFNYRMNELEASLGIIQMKEINNIIAERQKLAKIYIKLLENNSDIITQKVLPSSRSVWQAFVIYLKNIRSSNALIEYLRGKNIEINIGTYALHNLKFYRDKYGYKINDYPNAYKLYTKCITLPFYNGIKEREIRYIINKLKGVLT